ncbi:protein disulfide isomerase-like 5-2 [Iris pallida]|uniref:Protein disulfide isomerase-like 5-2 n=1 Tax=Iris pallida TaxID=29817 RepID=A0AAX6HRJ7_IRIPA|nr:protein disulfide isomerase-like 5-2 [Iris pallida]KAJ6843630.1 protein disulfide isomerase-like 5-2 [Iris pallida]KAJ6853553.1 protein disulfide isomerase-like 5-2 [Iris pallida]
MIEYQQVNPTFCSAFQPNGEFLEDFIKQNQLPLVVPINFETLKQLNDDKRKIMFTIVEDEMDQNSLALAKTLRAATNANHDLVFGYVGVKQWEEFVETFNVNKGSELPKITVWDGTDEYQIDGYEYGGTDLVLGAMSYETFPTGMFWMVDKPPQLIHTL